MGDDDEAMTRGAKRKGSELKQRKKNPLAAARGRKDFDKIWHCKSGAGYSLFVDYYANQPLGVVVAALGTREDRDAENPGTSPNADATNTSMTQTAVAAAARATANPPGASSTLVGGRAGAAGRGMSRAAKKRRKKRKRDDGGDEGTEMGAGGTCTSSTTRQATSNAAPSAILTNSVAPAAETAGYTISEMPDRTINTELLRVGKRYPFMWNFLAALSRPLPITFRIRHHSISKNEEKELRKTLDGGRYNQLVYPCPFGNDRIYQSARSLSKSNLQSVSPQLKQLLNEKSVDGSIARQELGSMVPVFLLHDAHWLGFLRPGMRVLDLCASPGSKTLQAAEIVAPSTRTMGTPKKTGSGRVRANDVNPSRLKTLEDAVSRSGVPNAISNAIKFTNIDATAFPIPVSNQMKYDAVLCDVPCSGDGTARKDEHILRNWTPNIANALHSTQLRILLRALQCVRVGGIVSYSTCSLNPVEDEAVVAAALLEASYRVCGGSSTKDQQKQKFQLMRIRPVSDGLVLRPGITEDWGVADFVGDVGDGDGYGDDEEHPRLRWYASFEEAKEKGMEHASEGMWRPRMKTPNGAGIRAPAEENSLPLDRCLRLLPQDQDTGGFFVAFIQRLS